MYCCHPCAAYSSDYLKLLRQELDDNGFPNTMIVAADSSWDIATDMLSDPALDKAVHAIGTHYPGMSSSSDAQKTGHLLLSSEDDSTFGDNIGTGEPSFCLPMHQVLAAPTHQVSVVAVERSFIGPTRVPVKLVSPHHAHDISDPCRFP